VEKCKAFIQLSRCARGITCFSFFYLYLWKGLNNIAVTLKEKYQDTLDEQK
jgi:hypothetical protein